MVLVDWQIRKLCMGDSPMISPFRESERHPYGTSRGLSIAGYNFSLGSTIKIIDRFKPEQLTRSYTTFNRECGESVETYYGTARSPHNISELDYIEYKLEDGKMFTVHPNTFLLAETEEYIKMPTNVNAVVGNKSTLARMGILHPITNFENGWEGRPTLELFFTEKYSVKIMKGMGIIHVMFHKTAIPEKNYSNRAIGGKYQNAEGLQTAKAG